MWKLISIFAVAFLFLPALTHAQDTTLSLSYNRQGVLKTAYSLQLRQSGECTYVGVRDVVFPDTIRFRIGADTAQELLAEALRLFDHPNPESPEPDMYVDNSMNVTAVLRLGESDLAGKKMLSFPEGVHDKGAWLLFQRL